MSCSLVLSVDKLPKVIEKVEFFVFRAAERKGISFLSLKGLTAEQVTKSLLPEVKTIIREYVEKYTEDAKYFQEVEKDDYQAKSYATFAANLETLLSAWDKEVVPNFIANSS
ncbi:MAG: hypothetical protein ACK518_01975, partial [bacterium]